MGLFAKKVEGKTAKEWLKNANELLDESQQMWREGETGWKGKVQEAIGCHDKALKIKSGDASLWYSKAQALLRLDKHEEAIKCYDRALDINPRVVNWWFDKGQSLHKLGKREAAIECYDKVIGLGQADSRVSLGAIYKEAWVKKGTALHELGEYYKAIECCDNALRLFPYDPEILAIKGKSMSRPEIGKYQEAIECCDASLSESERGDLWHCKGEVLLLLGKRSEATACFKKALALYGREKLSPEDLLLKGKVLHNLCRYEDVIPCFKEAIEIYGKSGDTFAKRQKEECIEGAVHAYILGHGGEIDIKKCAKQLRISESEIRASIGVLEAGGKLECG